MTTFDTSTLPKPLLLLYERCADFEILRKKHIAITYPETLVNCQKTERPSRIRNAA